MNRLLPLLAVCLACSFVAACGDDDDTVRIVVFQAAPDAIEIGQSTKLVFAVDPSDARVEISSVGNVTGQTQTSVSPTATTAYQLTATSGSARATQTVTVTVGASTAAAIKVEPMTTTPTAGDQLAVKLTVIGGDGKAAPGFRGTLKLTSTDPHATLPGDAVFAASDAGVKQVSVTLTTAGASTLIATETTGKAAAAGTATLTVRPGAAQSYRLSALPATAVAGASLVLTVTVLDAHGNIAEGYAGQMRVISSDPSDILPPAGGFVNGVRSVSLAFTKVGSHVATVQDIAVAVAPADTSSVAIGPAAPFRVGVAPANPTATAGAAEAFTATVFDFYSNVATDYTGTLHFAASDAQAVVPADFTFGAGDAGTHDFTLTLKTAGSASLAVSDTVASGVTGAASWTVSPAAASACVASQAPAAAVAGSVIGLTVAARDAFGNVATGYAGTVRLTASDARATLPGDVTYSPGDAGSHAFSAALITTGVQTVTATDVADATIQCGVSVMITPAAPRVALTLPGDANAGYAVSVGVAVKDVFDNAIPGYAGTVSFASSDGGTGAVTPAAIAFTGSEGGVATTSATFVTIGAQTLSASDAGTPQATGSAAARIHGLIYTGPNTGRVRLVANAAGSNTNTVQLDLIANERLELSTLFGGGPGSFSAGMNLPLDTTRVGAGAPLFSNGNALPLGAGTPAALGVLGADHVLYTAVSRKRVATASIFGQVTEVQAGQVFYSVRLKLTAAGTAGTVFDGAQPLAMYRAGVRDQWGNDFVGPSDIGVGKLEVR